MLCTLELRVGIIISTRSSVNRALRGSPKLYCILRLNGFTRLFISEALGVPFRSTIIFRWISFGTLLSLLTQEVQSIPFLATLVIESQMQLCDHGLWFLRVNVNKNRSLKHFLCFFSFRCGLLRWPSQLHVTLILECSHVSQNNLDGQLFF